MELNLITAGLKTVAILFVVLGLLVLTLYLMKRFLLVRQGAKGDLFIKVVSSLHLSPKERIEVIEVLGEKIVVGVAPGNISFLTRLNDSDKENKKIEGKRKDHDTKE